MNQISILGLVLSGGQSSRMGRDKAQLQLCQQTYLELARQRLSPYCTSVWVSGDYPQWPSIPDLPELREQSLRGPLAGIYSAFERLNGRDESNGILIIPVDMPLLDPAHLQQVIAQIELEPARPCYIQGSRFPLYLPLDQQSHRALSETLMHPQSRQRSVMALLTRLDATGLDPLDPARLININTPEQHQDLVNQMEK